MDGVGSGSRVALALLLLGSLVAAVSSSSSSSCGYTHNGLHVDLTPLQAAAPYAIPVPDTTGTSTGTLYYNFCKGAQGPGGTFGIDPPCLGAGACFVSTSGTHTDVGFLATQSFLLIDQPVGTLHIDELTAFYINPITASLTIVAMVCNPAKTSPTPIMTGGTLTVPQLPSAVKNIDIAKIPGIPASALAAITSGETIASLIKNVYSISFQSSYICPLRPSTAPPAAATSAPAAPLPPSAAPTTSSSNANNNNANNNNNNNNSNSNTAAIVIPIVIVAVALLIAAASFAIYRHRRARSPAQDFFRTLDPANAPDVTNLLAHADDDDIMRE